MVASSEAGMIESEKSSPQVGDGAHEATLFETMTAVAITCAIVSVPLWLFFMIIG